jgi:hypothetical protein
MSHCTVMDAGSTSVEYRSNRAKHIGSSSIFVLINKCIKYICSIYRRVTKYLANQIHKQLGL